MKPRIRRSASKYLVTLLAACLELCAAASIVAAAPENPGPPVNATTPAHPCCIPSQT